MGKVVDVALNMPEFKPFCIYHLENFFFIYFDF